MALRIVGYFTLTLTVVILEKALETVAPIPWEWLEWSELGDYLMGSAWVIIFPECFGLRRN